MKQDRSGDIEVTDGMVQSALETLWRYDLRDALDIDRVIVKEMLEAALSNRASVEKK